MTQRSAAADIFRGIGILFLFHIGGFLLTLLLLSIAESLRFDLLSLLAIFLLFAPGLSQLFYAIPLCIRFRKQRRFNAMKGVIIGAVITMLLNGGCFFLAIGSELGGYIGI